MDRLACVDLPAFPLQQLLRAHPEWQELPAAVVADDTPQAVILWVNEQARQRHVLPGHRHGHALALAGDLRAGVVHAADIAAAGTAVAALLRRFSPEVEPSAAEPGVFWLNATGLLPLYSSLHDWARAVVVALEQAGWRATVVVGFARFSTYALARAHRLQCMVLDEPEAERRAAGQVPLARLDLAPRLRDALERLGITTVAGLAALPQEGVRRRFGAAAQRLHALATGNAWDPLQPVFPAEPLARRLLLDEGERDVARLLFAIKRGLDPLLAELARRRQALSELLLELQLERAAVAVAGAGDGSPARCEHRIRPAEPSLDRRALLSLVHLRLEAAPPPAPVIEIALDAASVPATREQLDLFAQRPRRDLRAADRAFARLRAEFGDQAIVQARLGDGHLPEAQYSWVPLERAVLPRCQVLGAGGGPAVRPLVRRIYLRPLRLAPHTTGSNRDDGWLLAGLRQGPVVRVHGPHVISGGWWRGEVHRDYHFIETRRGDLLWVYYDRVRRRWFLHGVVA
jgi:protein ImuB